MLSIYRQVPRKPRLAFPIKYEVYLTGVGGDESAQSKNNKIYLFALKKIRALHGLAKKHQHFRATFVSPVRVNQWPRFTGKCLLPGCPALPARLNTKHISLGCARHHFWQGSNKDLSMRIVLKKISTLL
jgi:hypothetical protein